MVTERGLGSGHRRWSGEGGDGKRTGLWPQKVVWVSWAMLGTTSKTIKCHYFFYPASCQGHNLFSNSSPGQREGGALYNSETEHLLLSNGLRTSQHHDRIPSSVS